MKTTHMEVMSSGSPAVRPKGATSVWFYAAVAALVVCVWGAQVYTYHKAFDRPGRIISQLSGTSSEPTDWQKMSADTMTDTNRLLTTLGTAMLGALGLLMGNKVRNPHESQHMWAAFLGAIGAGLSLYFGYVSHLNLLAMISNQTISPYDPVYLFSSHAQFYALLAGAFFVADFAVHDLNQERTK
jgi:hypothetical protein